MLNFTKLSFILCSCCENTATHICNEGEFFCGECKEAIDEEVASGECEVITFDKINKAKCSCGSDAEFYEHDNDVIACSDCSFVMDHESKHDYMPDDFYLETRL